MVVLFIKTQHFYVLFSHLQEQILIRSTDWISIVHLIDLHCLRQGFHNELAHLFQSKSGRVECIDRRYRLTGITLS